MADLNIEKAAENLENKIESVEQKLDTPPTDAEDFKLWRTEQKTQLEALMTEVKKLAEKPQAQSAEMAAALQGMQTQMGEIAKVLASLTPPKVPETPSGEPGMSLSPTPSDPPSPKDAGDPPAPKPKPTPKPQAPPDRKRKVNWL